MWIGAIPDAALRHLTGKCDLGIHTEMFSDGVVDLAAKVTNRANYLGDSGVITSGFFRRPTFVQDPGAWKWG